MIAIRLIALIVGIVCVAIVIGLGIETSNNTSALAVALFGLASALLAPTGLALIAYSVSSREKSVLQSLSKVPEIEKLIDEANTQEKKLKVLQEQQQLLSEIIRFEARKQSLSARRADLEQQAVTILRELDAIDQESVALKIDLDTGIAAQEIAELQKRIKARQSGAMVIQVGSRSFVFDVDIARSLPGGNITADILGNLIPIINHIARFFVKSS